MSRLRLRPRGFIPDIAFGREPSNSTGGTLTHVDASFPSAHLNFGVRGPAQTKQQGPLPDILVNSTGPPAPAVLTGTSPPDRYHLSNSSHSLPFLTAPFFILQFTTLSLHEYLYLANSMDARKPPYTSVGELFGQDPSQPTQVAFFDETHAPTFSVEGEVLIVAIRLSCMRLRRVATANAIFNRSRIWVVGLSHERGIARSV